MPDFTYTARTLTGQKVTGKLSAGTKRDALTQLGQQQLFPLEVVPAKAAGLGLKLGWGRGVSAQVLATTYGQLADLLRSGVPLLRSLKIVLKQSRHAGLTAVFGSIVEQVEEGASLADAMARHPKIFNDLAVSIVRAGGEGGFLEEGLEQVADFTEKQQELKSRTLGAIAYPVFLCVVGVLVVSGLMIFLVPSFEGLFARLRERGELPVVTEWLLWASDTLQNYGIWILLVGLGFGAWAYTQAQTEAGRRLVDTIKIRIPIAGAIFLHLAVARFCRVLGTLLHNGVPIIRSLEISSGSTGNVVLAKSIHDAAENISSGQTLSKPLAASGHFPVSVVEMIAVAEEANTLEKVLINIADGLDRRTWRRLDMAVRLLEPMMLLLLAAAVLLIVLALLLPVVKMSTVM